MTTPALHLVKPNMVAPLVSSSDSPIEVTVQSSTLLQLIDTIYENNDETETQSRTVGTLLGTRSIFSTSINYLELLSRLPLSILFPVDTICGLGFVLSCASSKTKLSKYSFDQFEINLDEVWKCYCTTIKLAQNLEKLRQPFPILAHIPKLSHESLIKICGSVDAGGERETTGI